MPSSAFFADFIKGAVGGDRGWDAAVSSFRFAVDAGSEFEEPESRNIRNPTARTAAKRYVMEFVRRMALGKAMMREDRTM